MAAYEDRSSSSSTAAAAAAAIANAEHLDQLEASEQVTDIASFQDIELPPPDEIQHDVNYHYGNGSNSNNEDGLDNNNTNVVGVRRAKRFYYCLPMMQQYKYMILGCLSVFILVIVATSLTASSARNAKLKFIAQQQMAANNNSNNHNNDHSAGGTIINDAPPSPTTTSSSSSSSTNTNHDEELGDVIESDETDGTQPPRETPFPTTAFHYEQHNNNNHPAPSPSSSSSSSTSTSSSGSSSSSSSTENNENNNKPKWFTTNHEQYKSILMMHQSYGKELHSHSIAGFFCQELNMILCSYEDYCPNGIRNDPYEGPHDGSHLGWDASQAEQWAPYMSNEGSSADERIDWVQVGTMPEYEDGTYENRYGRCYSFLAWENSDNDGSDNGDGSGMDIEDFIETNHRRWILCCHNK